MPDLQLGIDPDVLGQITELPAQVLSAVGNAQQAVDDAQQGTAGADALAGLFSTLESLPDALSALPDVGGLIGGLSGITELLPPELSGVGDIGPAIDAVKGLFGPIGSALQGDVEGVVTAAVAKVSELATTLAQESDAAGQIGSELTEFLQLLGSLDDWDSSAPDVDEVVALLARMLLGTGPDLLDAPSAALDAALGSLTELLPSGDDLTRWRAAAEGQLELWASLEARVAVAADIDWPALEVELQAAGRVLVELVAARDRLISNVINVVARLDLSALDDVAAALREIPAIPDVRLTPILDGMRNQIRGLRDGLASWQPDADDGRRLVRELVRRLLDMLERTPLGQARRLLLTFEQRVLAAIESLPLRSVADEITGALRDVSDAIESVGLEEIIEPIRTFGDSIRDKVTAISGNAVQESVGRVWDAVEGALGDAASLLEQLRDALQSVTGPITSFTSTVQPTLTAVNEVLTSVREVLEAFDLAQPAAVVIDQLHRARDVVAAIDVSVLPADAVQLVKQAADAVKDIDVAGAISGPLAEVLDQVDPGPLLEEASAFLRDVAAQLQAIDPVSIGAELDGPVDTVLEAMAGFDPTQLRSQIDEALTPVREAIGQIDATDLLAPATRAFAEVLATLDSVLDPAPVFQPLQELFQPVIDLIEALDPNKLMELISPHGDALTEGLGPLAGPPATLSEGGAAALAEVTSTVDASDDLFGFRPGDLLVPLVDLHARLMTAFDALDLSVLDQAATALHGAFGGRLAALRPDAVLARIEEALAAVEQDLGAIATTKRLTDSALTYQRISTSIVLAAQRVDPQSPNAAVSARVTVALPSLDPLRLVASAGQADALSVATAAGKARADVASLRAAYAGGVARLEGLLTSFPGLLGDPLDGSGFRDALRALDPGPIRDEVNELFDEAGRLLAGLEEFVSAAVEEAAMAVEELLFPLNPSALLGIATRAHAAVLDQVKAISPAVLEEHVRLVFAAVRQQLELLDPATLAAQVDEIRQGLLDAVDNLLDGLLPDPAPFLELQTRLAGLRPSQLLGSITAALEPVTDLVASVDPDALVQPLLDAITRVRDQLPDVIAQIEAAFDEILDAFPEGGVSGGSSSAGGSIG